MHHILLEVHGVSSIPSFLPLPSPFTSLLLSPPFSLHFSSSFSLLPPLLQVYHKRQDLLKHPLVASFIHFKWNLFGKYVYYPNIIVYTLLMLMLTIYMFLQFNCELVH